MPVRALAPALLAALALAVAACGGGGDGSARAATPVQVRLRTPTDGGTVTQRHVTVRGTVSPAGAEVRIMGRLAEVAAGAFAMDVALERGGNVIDVSATRPGSAPAFTTARVTYDDRVTVPPLVGRDPDRAKNRLEDLGLQVDSRHGGPFYDGLLSGDPEVCSARPAAGARLRPGTTVALVWARRCD